MKRLAFVLLLVALPLLPQDQSEVDLMRAAQQVLQGGEIKVAIAYKASFHLPDSALGTDVKVTAERWISNDGYELKLSGVVIKSDKLIVQADQLSYRWATGEIEPSGNVRVKAIQK